MSEERIELVAFDMEGVLTRDPTVWEIMHRKLGTWHSHGEPYWRRYLAGEFHYDEFARMDVGVWKGAREELLRDASEDVALMDGARHALKRLREAGVRLALISNGITHLARRIGDEFGFDYVRANRVVAQAGALTGAVALDVPWDDKGEVLAGIMEEMDAEASAVASVGDSAADIGMFERSRIAVAVRPSDPTVAAAATHVLPDHDLSPLADIILGG
jgi:phosphoserine phosphatase